MAQPAFYPTPDGTDTSLPSQDTLNQQYNQAVSSGKFSGSFAQFLDKARNNGWLDKGINTLETIKSWLTGSPAPTSPSAPIPNNKTFQISGTAKTLLIIGGVLVVGLVGWGIYTAAKSGKVVAPK